MPFDDAIALLKAATGADAVPEGVIVIVAARSERLRLSAGRADATVTVIGSDWAS